ncbi:hypothetical protein AJ79_10074 [Helicocarpus griseus UAMH5409]|uniref:Uncharacterized protein n=1 Tax=Helicocarpus griseus UAMH5409 TaxID=1447875 RepID=A0A2B7WG21_9EURO|nr:hypothetical protein AJ79_10074 [Helicocarpus griseus UAMH5409]
MEYFFGGESGDINNLPRLTFGELKRALPHGVNVTLFTTACNPAGWLVQPLLDKVIFPNVLGIAGSGTEQEAQPWSFSRSMERACTGSTASIIPQSVISIEEQGQNEAEIFTHPTYLSLACTIFETVKRIDLLAGMQGALFSGQDDETCSMGRKLRYRATEYLSSKLGKDNLGGNISLHSTLRKFLNRETQLSDETILRQLVIVQCRLGQLQDVDEYLLAMGIGMPSSKDYAVEEWERNEKLLERHRLIMEYLRKHLKQQGYSLNEQAILQGLNNEFVDWYKKGLGMMNKFHLLLSFSYERLTPEESASLAEAIYLHIQTRNPEITTATKNVYPTGDSFSFGDFLGHFHKHKWVCNPSSLRRELQYFTEKHLSPEEQGLLSREAFKKPMTEGPQDEEKDGAVDPVLSSNDESKE